MHVAQSEFVDEKCFLPAYFILSSLLTVLSEKGNASNNNTSNSNVGDDNNNKKYAVLLDTELHELISESCS